MNQHSISKSMIMPYGERVGTKMGPKPNVVDKGPTLNVVDKSD